MLLGVPWNPIPIRTVIDFLATAWLNTAGFWAMVLVVVEVVGILSAYHAVMSVRTSQGAAAWGIALVTFPWVALPLYWILGRNKFQGYREAIKKAQDDHELELQEIKATLEPYRANLPGEPEDRVRALNHLRENYWFQKGNRLELLIDGPATFDAIFEAIDNAQSYLLVQFFIVHDDALGRKLKDKLIAKAREGVRVYFLYDEIGSHKLPKTAYLKDLKAAGIQVSEFHSRKGKTNRFQINFRNHRKIVVADGHAAFVGGHNVGDEYMGKNAKFGHWRDTHVRIEGPDVQSVQGVFLADWYWTRREVPGLNWRPRIPDGIGDGMKTLTLPTGPADKLEACTLLFHTAINCAENRLWIASPYFVPDEGICNALQLAAIRGVDVRIMIPAKVDHLIVYLAAFAYFHEMEETGVKIYRYGDGFLHQKVFLVDDWLASVGTANLDNRSMRLNFEISQVVADRGFASDVAGMLEEDFLHSKRIDMTENGKDDYRHRGLPFQLGVRVARLFAPVL